MWPKRSPLLLVTAALLVACGGRGSGGVRSDTGTADTGVEVDTAEGDVALPVDAILDSDTRVVDDDTAAGTDTIDPCVETPFTRCVDGRSVLVQTCHDGLCAIPPGQFVMGFPPWSQFHGYTDSFRSYGPVRITYPFLIQQTEMTIREFKALGLDDLFLPNPYNCVEDERHGCVLEVRTPDGYDAKHLLVARIANALSVRDGVEPCYNDAGWPTTESILACPGYRPPSEAEWEYAARAGTATDTFNGDVRWPDAPPCCHPALDEVAWYRCTLIEDLETRYHPVGLKQANPWGLHDVVGNIWELTLDRHRNGHGREPWSETRVDPEFSGQPGPRLVKGGDYFSCPPEVIHGFWSSRSYTGLRFVRRLFDVDAEPMPLPVPPDP